MLVRTNVNMDAQQLQHVKYFCETHELSMSAVIREAVDQYMKANTKKASMFGFLKGQLPDGLAYQQACRADEE